ncbi:hypothetical protein Cs7R123_60040 [Catellatospora sp. TT07R-123]|uniref:YidB family protein n=1 Tax=Catellatospora sp. TT07R-123 TaxID=2733863 RepID=UPI001B14B94F|nr:YidB family protein [Catellatospora sp. TT07R-123]GHJ48662.1 hypothetical protein Cs7R123_60040 [Catellatospora sp. TT07R-123]
MAVDLNQIMKLMSDPTVQKLVQGLLGQLTGGKGGSPNLAGLMDQLNKTGLGTQAQSWMSTGQNEPVTGAQLQQALGGGMLDQIASDAGTTPREAADSLAKVLPTLVDQATPNGQMPDPQQMQQMMSKFMGGGA